MEAKDISIGNGDEEDIDYGDLQEFSFSTSHETTTRDAGEERLMKTGHIRDDIEEPGSDSLTDFLIVRNDEDSDEDEEGMVDDTEHPDIDTKDLDNGETFGVSDHDMQYETSIENKPLINHCESANVKNEPCDIESDIGQPVLREGNIPSDIESDIGRPVIHERNTQSYIESDKKEPLLHEDNNPRYAESNREEPVEHKEKTVGYIKSNTRESVEHEEKTVLRDCFVSLSYLNVSMTKGGCLQCLKCKSTYKKASVLEKHIKLNNCDKKQSARSATTANSLHADVNVKQEYEELDEMNTLQESFTLQADTVCVCTLCRETFSSLVEYLDHQYICQMKATSAVKHEPNEEEHVKVEPCSSEPSKVRPVITGIFENGRTRVREDPNSESFAKRRKLQRNAQPDATIALSRSNTTLRGKIPETRPRANEIDTQCFPVSLQRVIPASGQSGGTLSQPWSDPVKVVFECTLCQQWFENQRQLGEHMATMHVELEHDIDPDPDLDPIEMEEDEMTEQVTLDEPHDEQNGTSDIRENFRENQRTKRDAGSQTLNRGSKPDKPNYKTAKAIIADKDELKHVKHNDKRAKAVNRADKGKTTTTEAAKHVPGERKVSVKAKTVTVKHGIREKMTTLTVKQAIRRKIIESLKKRAVARREISQDSQISDPTVMKCFFNDCQETFMSEIKFKAHLKEEFQKLNEKIKTWVRFKGKIDLETLRHYLNDLDFNIVVFSCNHPGCGQMFIDLAECQSHYDTHQGAAHVFVSEQDGCNRSLTSKPDIQSHVICAHPDVKGNIYAWSLKDPQTLVQAKKLNEVLSSSIRERLKAKVTSKSMPCFFENCTKTFKCKEQLIEHIKKAIYVQNKKLEAGEQLQHRIGKANLVKHLYAMQIKVVVYFCNQLSCGQIFFDSEEAKIHQTKPHGCKPKLDFEKSQNFLDHVETKTETIPEDDQIRTNDMAKTVTPDSSDMTEALTDKSGQCVFTVGTTYDALNKSIISCSHSKDTLSAPRTQGFPSDLKAHVDRETAKKADIVQTQTGDTAVSASINSDFPKGSAKPNKIKGFRKLLPKPPSCSHFKDTFSQRLPTVLNTHADTETAKLSEMVRAVACNTTVSETLNSDFLKGSATPVKKVGLKLYRKLLPKPLSKEGCRPLSTPSTQETPSVPRRSAKPDACAETSEKQIPSIVIDWTSHKWHEWVKSSEKGGNDFVWRDIKSKETLGSDSKAGGRDSGTSKAGGRDSVTSKAGGRDSVTSKAGGRDSETFKCCFAACREVYSCEEELQQHIQKKHLNVEYRRQFKSPCDPFSFDSKQVEINQETNHGCKSNREFKKKFYKSQHFIDHAETRTEEMSGDGQIGTNNTATTATPDSTDVTNDTATTATLYSTDVTETLKDKSIISCSHGKDRLSTPKTQGFPSAVNADTKTAKKAEMVQAETGNTTGTDSLNSDFPHGSAKPNKYVGIRNILTEPLSCSQIKEERRPLSTPSDQGTPSVLSGSAKPGLRNILTEPPSCSQIKEECRPLSTPSDQGTPSVPSGSAKHGLRNILTEPLSRSQSKEECRPLSTPSDQGTPSVHSGSAKPDACSEKSEKQLPLNEAKRIAETATDWTSYKWHEWVKGSEKGETGKGLAQKDLKSEEILGSDSEAGSRDSGTFKCCFAACPEVYCCDKDLQQHIKKKHLYVEFESHSKR